MSKSIDLFAKRMKDYEFRETERNFLPYVPVYARIDGRSFSRFTKGCTKPFDPVISTAMIAATEALVRDTKALIAYTASDEISLVWETTEPGEELMFRGKIQKMCSVLAGLASSAFMRALLGTKYENRIDRLPHFDCRVVQMPNRQEAANMFLWREQDARKNAVSMAAQAHFSHKSLQGLKTGQLLDKLADAGVCFNDYPAEFRNGAFVRRIVIEKSIEEGAWLAIPEHARPEKGTVVKRSQVGVIPMIAPFGELSNQIEMIFEGDDPEVVLYQPS